MAGTRVRIDEPPARLRSVRPFEDLLPDRRIETAVRLGEAADTQAAGKAGKGGRDARCAELRRLIPSDATWRARIEVARHDAARHLSCKNQIDFRRLVAMRREA